MKPELKYVGLFGTEGEIENIAEKTVVQKTGVAKIMAGGLAGKVSDGKFVLLLWGQVYSGEHTSDKAKYVLELYYRFGEKVLKHLDGEFTFMILSEHRLVVGRDRHGAGPQFFYSDKRFSSSLFELAAMKGFQPSPDVNALSQFLSIGYIPSPQTSLLGVKKLPGGSCLTYENGKIQVHDLFTFEEYRANYNTLKMSAGEAVGEYERLHKEAIAKRIAGKQNVALLMSGGYDSGGNICALRDIYQGRVQTFSIGFKNNPWSELPLAAKLSEVFGSEHHEYEIDGSEILSLPTIAGAIGDPFQEGGLMLNYLAMGLIGNDKPEIILGGDGNDQLHGTAGKELALHYKLKKMGLLGVQGLASSVLGMPRFDKNNKFFRIKFHNDKIHNIMKSDNFGFSKSEVNRLLADGLSAGNHAYLDRLPKRAHGFDELFIEHNYFADIKQVVNEVILFKASRMAELYGNSLSFPYMSAELYDFLSTVPRDLKFHGPVGDLSKGKGVSKYLHKTYLKPRLPAEITERKKQGGFAPLPIFFKSDENRALFTELITKSGVIGEILRKEKVVGFLKKYDAEASQPSYWFWYDQVKAFQYFNLLVLAVWWKIMFEHREGLTINEFV